MLRAIFIIISHLKILVNYTKNSMGKNKVSIINIRVNCKFTYTLIIY